MPEQPVPKLLRARAVWPVSGPWIPDGAIFISHGRIAWVGPWKEASSRVPANLPFEDLGEVAVIPGFVNAHAHLEYSDLAGVLPSLDSFAGWIGGMLRLKASRSPAEVESAWRLGAQRCLLHGTTSVVDMVSGEVPWLPAALSSTPLKVSACREITGLISGESAGVLLKQAREWLAELPVRPGIRHGLAPHAPYSCSREVFEGVRQSKEDSETPWTTHLAESREEDQMFRSASGVLYERLKEQGRSDADCGQGAGMVDWLRSTAPAGRKGLLAHVNLPGEDGLENLPQVASGVVHCPGSHSYFGHPPFPLQEIMKRELPVCLGTDSAATEPGDSPVPGSLSLYEEMRRARSRWPEVPAELWLRMVTSIPARIWGVDDWVGTLSPGTWADLQVLPCPEGIPDLAEAIIQETLRPARLMVEGNWWNPEHSDE